MKSTLTPAVLAVLFSCVPSGCSTWDKLNGTERGAVIGAGSGAAIGGVAGNTGGALVGGAVGGVAGGLIGREMDKDNRRGQQYDGDRYDSSGRRY